MNIPDYISSGILELYVAGALSEQDAIEVTTQVHQYPELRETVEMIERAFIKYASLHAPPIPPNLGNSILDKTAYASARRTKERRDQRKGKTMPLRRNRPASHWLRVAAGLALFLFVSLLANLYQYNQLQTKEQALQQTAQKLLALQTEQQQLVERFQVQTSEYGKAITILNDPETKQLALKATGNAAKTAHALVYWHKATQHVFVYAPNLPAPPPDKSYQLWSLTDMDPLTPVDAGILADFSTDKDKFFSVKNIDASVAFAITLEPKGGSASPTLDHLQVLGQW